MLILTTEPRGGCTRQWGLGCVFVFGRSNAGVHWQGCVGGEKGRYGRLLRTAITIVNQRACLGDLQLRLTGHKEADAAKLEVGKAFSGQSDVLPPNPTHACLRDFREWRTPTCLLDSDPRKACQA